jgi:hypothetical protein
MCALKKADFLVSCPHQININVNLEVKKSIVKISLLEAMEAHRVARG